MTWSNEVIQLLAYNMRRLCQDKEGVFMYDFNKLWRLAWTGTWVCKELPTIVGSQMPINGKKIHDYRGLG